MLMHIRLQNKNYSRTRRNIAIRIGIRIGIYALREIQAREVLCCSPPHSSHCLFPRFTAQAWPCLPGSLFRSVADWQPASPFPPHGKPSGAGLMGERERGSRTGTGCRVGRSTEWPHKEGLCSAWWYLIVPVGLQMTG